MLSQELQGARLIAKICGFQENKITAKLFRLKNLKYISIGKSLRRIELLASGEPMKVTLEEKEDNSAAEVAQQEQFQWQSPADSTEDTKRGNDIFAMKLSNPYHMEYYSDNQSDTETNKENIKPVEVNDDFTDTASDSDVEQENTKPVEVSTDTHPNSETDKENTKPVEVNDDFTDTASESDVEQENIKPVEVLTDADPNSEAHNTKPVEVIKDLTDTDSNSDIEKKKPVELKEDEDFSGSETDKATLPSVHDMTISIQEEIVTVENYISGSYSDCRVEIVSMDARNVFWLRREEDSTVFSNMDGDIQRLHKNRKLQSVEESKIRKNCAYLAKVGDNFFRATVPTICNPNVVFRLDLGDTVNIEAGQLFPLPLQFSQFPCFTFSFALNTVLENNLARNIGEKIKLKVLMENCSVFTRHTKRTSDGVPQYRGEIEFIEDNPNGLDRNTKREYASEFLEKNGLAKRIASQQNLETLTPPRSPRSV